MKTLFVLFFMLLHTICFSQNRKIKGKIIDTTNAPIIGQMVTVINSETNITYSFTQTNKLGEFSFEIDTTYINPALAIKSSFYKHTLIQIKSNLNNYIITLHQQLKELAPVKVIAFKPAIRRTGDTLRYNLNSFANNNDRVIADILPKIPGVEVGNNGVIKYNGMPISNFFIDGDNILDKRYNIATNNISKDIVDEIQILENNQPIKVLQGVDIPNNAAMNITFKKNFKGKIINNLNVFFGIPKLVEFDYNQVVLKQKLKAINYVKYNNIGTDYLVEHNKQDLSELSKQIEINWSEKLFSLNTVPPPMIQKFRYNYNSNFANSVNLLFKFKKDYILKSNSFINIDAIQIEYKNKTEIFLPAINVIFRENQTSENKPTVLYQEFNFFKNSSKFYLNNQFIGEFNKGISNAILENTYFLNQRLNEKNYKLKNEFKFIKKIKSGLIDCSSLIEWNKNPQSLFLNKGVLKNILNDSLDYDETQQFAENSIFFIKNQIAYSSSLIKIKYKLNLGNLITNRNNNTNILLLNNGLLYEPLNNLFKNAINTNFSKLFFAFNSTYQNANQKIDFEISPSLFTLKVHTNNIIKNYNNILAINTSFNLKQQIGRESSIRLNYTFKNEPTEIGLNFENSYLQNYRSLYFNRLPYLAEKKHNIYINYNFQRSLKLLFVNFTISKTYSILDYIFNNEVKSNYVLSTYSLYQNDQSNINSNLNISKYIFKLKTTLGFKINIVHRNFAIIQNGNLVKYISSNRSVVFNFRPTINDYFQLNTELAYSNFYNIQKNKFSAIPKITRIGNITSLDILFSKKISFKIKNEILKYNNKITNNSNANNFIDVFAKFTNNKKSVAYEFKCLNILNKNSYQLQQTEVNFIQQSDFLIRPLTLLLSANIKL